MIYTTVSKRTDVPIFRWVTWLANFPRGSGPGLVATLVMVGSAGATWADLARRMVGHWPSSRRFFWPRSYYAPCGQPPDAPWWLLRWLANRPADIFLSLGLYRFGLLLFLRSPPRSRRGGDPAVARQAKLFVDAWASWPEVGSPARFGSRAHLLVAPDASK